MFLLNSCLSLFSAAHLRGLPLSRSYGDILPSSLTMLLPSALGFSPHPPVSVYGTGYAYAIVAFLGSHIWCFTTNSSFPLAGPDFPFPAHPFCLRPHSSDMHKCRNINLLSIDYAVWPRLRSRLPQGRSALPWNPWIFGLEDSHLHLATHSGILSSQRSAAPYGTVSTPL